MMFLLRQYFQKIILIVSKQLPKKQSSGTIGGVPQKGLGVFAKILTELHREFALAQMQLACSSQKRQKGK